MHYLVFDFETTGLDKDASTGYKPYPADVAPLPRANYPVELAAELITADGTVLRSMRTLITGAERLAPWVLEHCPHLSVGDCEQYGVQFAEAVRALAEMVEEGTECTLVAHNIQYDWDDVLVATAREQDLDSPAWTKLRSLPRFCTCVNEAHKAKRTSYYFKKIGKWVGPNLGKLAKSCGVEYDETRAHDAPYDVRVTSECLVAMLAANDVA